MFKKKNIEYILNDFLHSMNKANYLDSTNYKTICKSNLMKNLTKLIWILKGFNN